MAEFLLTTDILLTVNTHIVYQPGNLRPTPEHERMMLRAFNQLRKPGEMKSIIRHMLSFPNGTVDVSINGGLVSVEIAPKTRQLHAHGSISIRHRGMNLRDEHDQPISPGLNEALQEWFSKKIGIEGIYVNANIDRDVSRAANYTTAKLQDATEAPGPTPWVLPQRTFSNWKST